MRRRAFLVGVASLTGSTLSAPALIARRAQAAEPAVPVDDLRKALDPKTAELLVPGDRQFGRYLTSYNLRTLRTPQGRVLAKAPQGIAALVAWARSNRVPLAVRSGGHSFEGFSQSRGLVVDTRPLDDIRIDRGAETVSVGAGQSIGAVYRRVADAGFAFAAGSCPTVGVAGNTLGGGFGLLARHVGLAADNLVAVEAVDGRGRSFTADSTREPDFFWACRGGGGGSFGVVTRFVFRLHPIGQVSVFGVGWMLSRAQAVRLMGAWQQWAPRARSELTSVLRIVRSGSELALRCIGLYAGTEAALRKELQPLLGAVGTPRPSIQTMSFMGAVNYFAGPDGWTYETKHMKAKSDYVTAPISPEGLETLMAGVQRLPPGGAVLICDGYGGALESLQPDATAFPHRRGTLYGIQYYTQWGSAGQTPAREAGLRDLYRAMRPFVSGGAYVNYPDAELTDWATSYWGANLPRLRHVKAQYDPDDIFRHAQSVPLP